MRKEKKKKNLPAEQQYYNNMKSFHYLNYIKHKAL